MTVVDWIIVAILAGSVLAGIAQGFLRSLFSFGGLILGLVVAAWNYDRIARFIRPVLHSDKVSNAIGFILVALLVAGLCAAMGVLLSKAFKKLGLGCLDSLAGAIFGFFQGALLVTVCILVTIAFFPDTEWLTQSRLPRYFFAACHLSTHISPSGLSQLVREDLNRLERNSPPWMHPGERTR
ncbi:MAG TPA: CvpA family protein [Terracidiphilus sp.]|jgi:membrane protein required for colicin V production|nr:CvpA family protein [Terracidiphilus sp.]